MTTTSSLQSALGVVLAHYRSAWADAYWPVTVIELLYAPAQVIWAREESVTIRVRGADHVVSWGVLHAAAWQGGDLGAIYWRLEQDAEQRLWAGRYARLRELGFAVGREEVGQRFGSIGVIHPIGRRDWAVFRGPLCPFASGAATDSAVVAFLARWSGVHREEGAPLPDRHHPADRLRRQGSS